MFYWIILGVAALIGLALLVRMIMYGSARLAWRIIGALAWTVIAGFVTWLTLKVSPGFGVVMLALLFPLWRAWLDEKQEKKRTKLSSGARSHLQTAFFDMTLDHDNGAMQASVRRGKFQGWQLQALDHADLQELRTTCLREDPPSAALLDAWLDKHGPVHWRHDFTDTTSPQPTSGNMTRSEALAVLGLDETINDDIVREAHKRLMLKNHPDQGGSDYLASKINQAKDLLLSK
jgi:uncharacterized membrane protein